jgi:DNA repair ATPase RecN
LKDEKNLQEQKLNKVQDAKAEIDQKLEEIGIENERLKSEKEQQQEFCEVMEVKADVGLKLDEIRGENDKLHEAMKELNEQKSSRTAPPRSTGGQSGARKEFG